MITDYRKYYSVGDKVFYEEANTDIAPLLLEILFIKDDNYAFVGIEEKDMNYHKVYNLCRWVPLSSLRKAS